MKFDDFNEPIREQHELPCAPCFIIALAIAILGAVLLAYGVI